MCRADQNYDWLKVASERANRHEGCSLSLVKFGKRLVQSMGIRKVNRIGKKGIGCETTKMQQGVYEKHKMASCP